MSLFDSVTCPNDWDQISTDFESCEHKIFECDHRLALEFLEYGTTERVQNTILSVAIPDLFYQWYNSNTRKCCAGKGIRKFDQSCLE